MALVGCPLGGTPHPVIVTIGDNRDYIRVLLYSYYTTISGWGGPPKLSPCCRRMTAEQVSLVGFRGPTQRALGGSGLRVIGVEGAAGLLP